MAIALNKNKLIVGDEAWDDIRFALVGRNIDTTSGRLDYDYYNGALGFQNNAEFRVQEAVSILCQMHHEWKTGTSIKPHLHWLQQAAAEPNWLLAYKLLDNGDTTTLETDFSNHTLLTKNSNAYTYSSGNLIQITNFGEIEMTGMGTSTMVHFVLFRDSDNDSALFAGSDPSSITELAFEFDVHYRKDSLGSDLEFTKTWD